MGIGGERGCEREIEGDTGREGVRESYLEHESVLSIWHLQGSCLTAFVQHCAIDASLWLRVLQAF